MNKDTHSLYRQRYQVPGDASEKTTHPYKKYVLKDVHTPNYG